MTTLPSDDSAASARASVQPQTSTVSGDRSASTISPLAPVRVLAPTHLPLGPGAVALALLTALFWGANAVANQFALDALAPMMLGFVRFFLAALFMLGWCLLDGSPLLCRRGQWTGTFLLGVLLCLQIGTFNYGNARSNSSHASVLVNSYIFWVAAWEGLIERTFVMTWRQTVGLLVSGAGCICLFLASRDAATLATRDTPTLTGDLILALSGLILAVKIVYTKKVVVHASPGSVMMWHDLIGAFLLLGVSLFLDEPSARPFTPAIWTAVLFSGLIVSGFCFGANALLLRRHGAAQVSVFSFLSPIFGVALGVWLRGDHLSGWLLVAGILTAAGIFLVNFVPGVRPRAAVSKTPHA